MGSMHLRADIRQSQTLSPRLQLAVRMLQMSSLDFAAVVRSKLEDNPFLEDPQDAQDGEYELGLLDGKELGEEDREGGMGRLAPEAGLSPDTAMDEGFGMGIGLDMDRDLPGMQHPPDPADHLPGPATEPADDRDLWLADMHTGARQGADGEGTAMDLAACETTLAMHLHGQLNVMAMTPRDLCMARAIVESLDDDGYLRTDLQELAGLLALSPAPDAQEMLIALRLVQSLDPAGVAARSVGECLLLQCPQIGDAHLRQLAQAMVQDHMDALAARDVPRLARALQVPPAQITQALACIRRLNPRPGWNFGSSHVDYIVPDVIVRRGQSGWNVHLNPAVVPRVRLNRVYEQLFQRHRRSGQNQLADHLQDARWTVRNVEQRFSTILDVAQAIVRKQQLFLEFGAMAMKPLVLREIAEEVGVHESTVSRVTNNKYMATPTGVFELKHFFSRPMLSASGNACSATAIRELIGDIIAAESDARPLSDVEIARQLGAQGLVVARRTVTKYRQLLRIEPADRRRRHA
ncbi:RNA polymerase factor sigma-54 [Delftia sp. SD018]|uniref:RNA polymerase factor sigma-54 n=1 Tax=unclassified Delftia TaxID=2613839 RepID=UPI001A970B37|nr:MULTISPECIES: RNA polymerase factor sigma-54 [unclassified Delftia]MBO0991198.1 RNA polymerase factor sigma-54 [Delftia sp. SD083]MBO1037628.1 RNA polymerase factor sigma-54 [Delftia sp. SD018]